MINPGSLRRPATVFFPNHSQDVCGRAILHWFSALAAHLTFTLTPARLLYATTFAVLAAGVCEADVVPSKPAVGPTGVVVQGAFGGTIFGFDIDPNGTSGVLSESKSMPDGTLVSAVETFDQATGQILAVVSVTRRHDDFITLGVVGNAVGLIEREHPLGLFHVERTFSVIDPLDSNLITGPWTPPLGRKQNIDQVRTDMGTSEVAVLAIDFSRHGNTTVFTSDVGANTFGPAFELTDSDFNFELPPAMAFDSKTQP